MTDTTKWNILVGVIMGSFLPSEEKQELIAFVREWEERSSLWDD